MKEEDKSTAAKPTWENNKEVSFKEGVKYLNVLKLALEQQLEHQKAELSRLVSLTRSNGE
jgi:hypothetical protein